MRRFALFVGNVYYPLGGWADFHDSYDDVEAAISAMREPIFPDGSFERNRGFWSDGSYWWHIVDMQATGRPTIVKRCPSIADEEELGWDEYQKQVIEL